MFNVHDTLRKLEYIVDNEYLEKYCTIIERNARTRYIARKTHKHHIIPKSWFKLTNNKINNDLNNLVNLSIREHFLAHYYLCLCSSDPFKFANQLALICLQIKIKADTRLLQSLPLYNYIYEDYKDKLRCGYKLYTSDKEDE